MAHAYPIWVAMQGGLCLGRIGAVIVLVQWLAREMYSRSHATRKRIDIGGDVTTPTYKYLRRYTTLPSLIYMLTEKKITLLDPKSWDDRNDYSFLARYKRVKNLKSLLALCFTVYEHDNVSHAYDEDDEETYHHWSVYGRGSAGVCIKFKLDELIGELKKQDGVIAGSVDYMSVEEYEDEFWTSDSLPFTKRAGFRHEQEFRVIYGSKDQKRRTLDIPFSLSTIKLIRFSPWLPIALSPYVESTLRSIRGCENLTISRSTLISNDKWMRLGGQAFDMETGDLAVKRRGPRRNIVAIVDGKPLYKSDDKDNGGTNSS